MSSIVHLVAFDEKGVMGEGDKLPFHIPEDMQNFKTNTQDLTVVAGFNTFKSLLDHYSKNGKVLEGRKIFVICSTQEKANLRFDIYKHIDNAVFVTEQTVSLLVSSSILPVVFIGGAKIYSMHQPSVVLATLVKEPVKVTDESLVVKYPHKELLEKTALCLKGVERTSTNGKKYQFLTYILK